MKHTDIVVILAAAGLMEERLLELEASSQLIPDLEKLSVLELKIEQWKRAVAALREIANTTPEPTMDNMANVLSNLEELQKRIGNIAGVEGD